MAETNRKHRTKADQLLRTKLMPPRLPVPIVPRPALLARLDEGMARALTLVAAPTGYGKTTLVAQWLGTRREPGAWVALDPGDDDPAHFWAYVITACRAFDPGLGKATLAALRSSRLSSLEAPVASLLNDLATAPTAGILVLEDYRAITSSQVHAGVAYLVDHLPATLHLVLITRAEPPLPLGRLRAHNQVSEIGAADLRFTPEETGAFLEGLLQVQLKPETAARLDTRIEGWAAGLRLAALALEGQRDPAAIERFLGSFSGGHRHVTEYLAGEVLGAQPEPLQEFLLRTSILDRLAAGLCDAVTGRSDGAGTLEQLERAGLFILPLGDDASQAWYRYHALFAEAMRKVARERFGEEGMRALYLRASAWHEEHGRLDQAIEAALAAKAYPRAAALIEQGVGWRSYHEVHTVRRWIEQLPPEALGPHPALCFEYAVAMLFTSDRYAAATAAALEAPLRMAESAWRRAEDGAGLGQALALRALVALWQDDLDPAFALARGSLELLPEGDAFWRGSDQIIAGIEELLAGRPGAAQAALIEARALSGAAGSLQGRLAATGLLGDACASQGEFDQACEIYRQVQAEAAGSEDMLDDQAAAALGLGAIAYERNDLAAAEREAVSALELGTHRANERIAAHAALLLARISQARERPTGRRGEPAPWPLRFSGRACCARCWPGRRAWRARPETSRPCIAGMPVLPCCPRPRRPACRRWRTWWRQGCCLRTGNRLMLRRSSSGGGRTRGSTGGPPARWRPWPSPLWPMRQGPAEPRQATRSAAPWPSPGQRAISGSFWMRASRCGGRSPAGERTSREARLA